VRQAGLRRASFRDDRCTVTPRRRNRRIEEKPQRGGVIQINVLAVLDSTYFFSRLSASTEDQDKRSCNSGDTQMLSKTFLSYCGKSNRKSKHSSTDLASQPRICISPRHHQQFIGPKTRCHLWRQTTHGLSNPITATTYQDSSHRATTVSPEAALSALSALVCAA